MNTEPAELLKFVSIRLIRRTPVFVNGGLTRWRIDSGHGGKGGKYYGCYANSVDDPTRSIKIFESRTRGIEGNEYKHMTAERCSRASSRRP